MNAPTATQAPTLRTQTLQLCVPVLLLGHISANLVFAVLDARFVGIGWRPAVTRVAAAATALTYLLLTARKLRAARASSWVALPLSMGTPAWLAYLTSQGRGWQPSSLVLVIGYALTLLLTYAALHTHLFAHPLPGRPAQWRIALPATVLGCAALMAVVVPAFLLLAMLTTVEDGWSMNEHMLHPVVMLLGAFVMLSHPALSGMAGALHLHTVAWLWRLGLVFSLWGAVSWITQPDTRGLITSASIGMATPLLLNAALTVQLHRQQRQEPHHA